MNKVMSRRLTDMRMLEGKTETITLMELRSRPGDVIAQVQMGKSFTITKSGKRVAELLPVNEPNAFQLGAEVRRLGLQGA
jgi:prevent-host-death family protein